MVISFIVEFLKIKIDIVGINQSQYFDRVKLDFFFFVNIRITNIRLRNKSHFIELQNIVCIDFYIDICYLNIRFENSNFSNIHLQYFSFHLKSPKPTK